MEKFHANTSASRLVMIHESAGVSPVFMFTEHPHPITIAGYGVSAIDWDHMAANAPYTSAAECTHAGMTFNVNPDTCEKIDETYIKTTEPCEAKIISITRDGLDEAFVHVSQHMTIKCPVHVCVDADTGNNVEFCFIGTMIEKYS